MAGTIAYSYYHGSDEVMLDGTVKRRLDFLGSSPDSRRLSGGGDGCPAIDSALDNAGGAICECFTC